MITILTIIHVVVCILLIGIVLLQHGKGADMGATFGGSGQTVFGTDGPLPLMNKITTGGAILFMLTSVTLAYHSAHSSKGSIMKNISPVSSPQEVEMVAPPAEVEIPLTSGTTETTQSTFPVDSEPTTNTEK